MTTDTTYSSTSLNDDAMATGQKDHPLAETGQELGQSAGHLAERATDIGFQRADQGKQQVAQGIEQLAGSIRRVSTDMQSEQPAIANAADTAADQAERIANYLRQTDAREILWTVEDVARRQPILFLGGAFLLGFAASRLLKAAGGGSQGGGQWAGQTGYASGANAYGYGAGTTGAYGATDAYGSTGAYGTTGAGTTDPYQRTSGTGTGGSATTDEGL